MMTKIKLKLKILITVLLLCCSVQCTSLAFDFQRACFNVEDAKPQDEASLFFWDWLLKQVKLSPQHAALHKVYQEDAVAIYYDLDGDGDDEIIGTHLSSAVNGDGETLLYILK